MLCPRPKLTRGTGWSRHAHLPFLGFGGRFQIMRHSDGGCSGWCVSEAERDGCADGDVWGWGRRASRGRHYGQREMACCEDSMHLLLVKRQRVSGIFHQGLNSRFKTTCPAGRAYAGSPTTANFLSTGSLPDLGLLLPPVLRFPICEE